MISFFCLPMALFYVSQQKYTLRFGISRIITSFKVILKFINYFYHYRLATFLFGIQLF